MLPSSCDLFFSIVLNPGTIISCLFESFCSWEASRTNLRLAKLQGGKPMEKCKEHRPLAGEEFAKCLKEVRSIVYLVIIEVWGNSWKLRKNRMSMYEDP